MDNRSHLLEVALDLFAEQGYDAVGVQAIVEAAGVTKPSLYHYFGSKRGLFEALVRERSRGLVETVRQASCYEGDLTGSIMAVVRAYFDYATRQPTFYRMLLSMWFAPPSSEYFPVVQEVLQEQTDLLIEMFRRAADDHGNMRGRHRLYAVSFKGLIDTYVVVAMHGQIDLKSDEFQHRMIHQFMHGIFS